MGIEQDIQQSQFRNSFQKAAINLLYTSGWLRDRMKVLFDKEDITAQQFNILRILRGSFPTPLSTLQIRDRMLEKMSDTSRLVDRLVVKGLVKKITAETDRRLVDVLITEKGKKLLSRIDAQQTEMDAILNNLTEKEAEQLSELLDKMRSAIG
ncbi:MAG TPA: MarR family transcriptional regulator [Chitinophagaceae bacterium]|nr:MarR family transcriptional regulator [Chitinophagaceae bacterium]HAL94990.1 MarR family transcriptional regulator [Chitinophagaceae bacterium]